MVITNRTVLIFVLNYIIYKNVFKLNFFSTINVTNVTNVNNKCKY